MLREREDSEPPEQRDGGTTTLPTSQISKVRSFVPVTQGEGDRVGTGTRGAWALEPEFLATQRPRLADMGSGTRQG